MHVEQRRLRETAYNSRAQACRLVSVGGFTRCWYGSFGDLFDDRTDGFGMDE